MKKFHRKKIARGPITTQIILIFLMIFITSIFALLNFEGQSPLINNGTLETVLVTMKNIFSKEGFAAIFQNLTMHFQMYEPVVFCIISLIGVSIFYRSGLLKNIERYFRRIKPKFITFFVIFISIASTYFGPISLVFLLPIVAIMYQYRGRNPLIGILTVFLGFTLGMGAGIFNNYQDYYLGVMTQLAATVNVDKNYEYQLLSTLYISIFSTGILSVIMTSLIENKVVPKFSNPEPLQDEFVIDKKAGYLSSITFLLLILVIIYLIFPGFSFTGLLLDKTQDKYILQVFGENSPFYQGLPYLFTLVLVICSYVYGKKSGNIQNSQDFNSGLSIAFDKTGYLFVLLFLGSVLLSILQWTNFPTIVASKFLDFMSVLEFSGMPLIVVTFVIFLIVSILLPIPASNWLILSPIVIPLLMRANITPEYTQFLFTATNGIASTLTPIFPYYLVLLGFYYKFSEKDAPITLFGPMKQMFPVIFPILGIWLLITVGWFLIGLPLGIGSFPTL